MTSPPVLDHRQPCQRCGVLGGQVLTWTVDGGSFASWVCPACVKRDEEKAAYMLKALKWIVQGRGNWDSDIRKHAANVIEGAIAAAKDAIDYAEAKP